MKKSGKNINNIKESLMMSEQIENRVDNNQFSQDELIARQEEYYWHCLQEFHAILKVFGTTKVMADLKKIKKEVDGVEEKLRIIIPSCC